MTHHLLVLHCRRVILGLTTKVEQIQNHGGNLNLNLRGSPVLEDLGCHFLQCERRCDRGEVRCLVRSAVPADRIDQHVAPLELDICSDGVAELSEQLALRTIERCTETELLGYDRHDTHQQRRRLLGP